MVDDENSIRVLRQNDARIAVWGGGEQRLIMISMRSGTWGILAGAGTYLLGSIGLRVPLGWALVGGGLLWGGVAVGFGSWLVLRRVWQGPIRNLKVAALLGLPFGATATVVGFGWLSRDLSVLRVTSLGTPILLLLGTALAILFGTGLMRRLWQAIDEESVEEA